MRKVLNLWKMRAIAAATVLLLAGSIPDPRAAAHGQDQDQKKTVIAIVQNVNVLRKTLTVLDTLGCAAEFSLGNGADIRGAQDSTEEFRTIYDLKPGNRVQITYTGTPDDPGHVRVVILQDHPCGGVAVPFLPYYYR